MSYLQKQKNGNYIILKKKPTRLNIGNRGIMAIFNLGEYAHIVSETQEYDGVIERIRKIDGKTFLEGKYKGRDGHPWLFQQDIDTVRSIERMEL